VRDTTRLLQVSISKRCALELDLPEGLPAVEADSTQVRQVLMNLVINASEALGDADGRITVRTGAGHFDRATLAEAGFDPGLPDGSYVWLEVGDSGIGMPAHVRTRIFEPFFTTKFTGRGLGLSAVLGIMRGHRGSISCASEPGKGTTFKALFPASSRPASGREPQASVDRAWRGSGTVLVVDDEESVRRMVRRLLEGLSFRVLLAKDGREGVDVFRSEGSTIDLVLLDMTMPHLDGPGALREMRRIRTDIKVILSSGYNEETAVANVEGDAPNAFIKKPYRLDEFVAVLREVIEGGGRTSQRATSG
jgi:two-component system, cell cycle sensor histidine kinase and response regulator CckA